MSVAHMITSTYEDSDPLPRASGMGSNLGFLWSEQAMWRWSSPQKLLGCWLRHVAQEVQATPAAEIPSQS